VSTLRYSLYTSFTLRRLISNAYEVTEPQVVGPAWITEDLFDIRARLPAGASGSDVPAMLRQMLEERFRLAVEREKKKIPVFALVVAKGGHKMRVAAGSDGGYGGGVRRIDGRGVTMATFAKLLSSRVAERPVIDATGLGGKFIFSLTWGSEEDGPSIYTALEEQLGLKLEARRMAAEVITVKRAERIPIGN
jgi:uncharacterized protein (TIGR03435 family)